MEKKEFKYISEIDGKPITECVYRLSRKEQEHLRDQILKGYNEAEVERFIRSIEVYLDFSCRILGNLNYRNRTAHRDRLLTVKKHFEATHKDLLQICSGRFRVLPPHQCDFVNHYCKDTENPQEKILREVSFNSSLAGERVQEIIKYLTMALEIEKTKRGGRRRADELDLAFQIARRFNKHIGIPRPYSGPFPDIIYYCFKIVGIKGNDRTRAIRHALRRIS